MLPPPNFVLFQLDFDVKFPLLRILLFLIDLKSTILSLTNSFLYPWKLVLIRLNPHYYSNIEKLPGYLNWNKPISYQSKVVFK